LSYPANKQTNKANSGENSTPQKVAKIITPITVTQRHAVSLRQLNFFALVALSLLYGRR